MKDTTETPLSLSDFQAVDLGADPVILRRLIDGLRALPNVSDMAIISAIAELDRIAGQFELAAARRLRIMQAIERIAAEKAPQLVSMVRAGMVPTDIVNQLFKDLLPPSPDCDCDRCRAHFGREPAAPTGKPHLNS